MNPLKTPSKKLGQTGKRHEIKFVVPFRWVDAVRNVLDHVCAPDLHFSANRIHSLYYDTPSMDLLKQKENSEYVKYKVRVRWYTDLQGRNPGDHSVLEIKAKEGAHSRKFRHKLDTRGADWHNRALDMAGQINLMDYADRDSAAYLRNLQPSLVVSYNRHRYVEGASGMRISLDSDIQGSQVNQRLLPGLKARRAAHAILEVKGAHVRSLPPALHSLYQFGVYKVAFSKYAETMNDENPFGV